jgi:hypothetical protein
MPRFITRVELHAASSDDYEKLHDAMEKKKFSRTVQASDGATYHLPTAEYFRSGAGLTCEQVRSDAKAAADSVWRSSAVLVTDAGEAKHYMLDRFTVRLALRSRSVYRCFRLALLTVVRPLKEFRPVRRRCLPTALAVAGVQPRPA